MTATLDLTEWRAIGRVLLDSHRDYPPGLFAKLDAVRFPDGPSVKVTLTVAEWRFIRDETREDDEIGSQLVTNYLTVMLMTV